MAYLDSVVAAARRAYAYVLAEGPDVVALTSQRVKAVAQFLDQVEAFLRAHQPVEGREGVFTPNTTPGAVAELQSIRDGCAQVNTVQGGLGLDDNTKQLIAALLSKVIDILLKKIGG